jgi:protoporphyrinogen oxidase
MKHSNPDFMVVGAGFTGLTIALRLLKAGKSVVILEKDSHVGGLAADFELENGANLERFYHHWFKSDIAINNLVDELGIKNRIKEYPSNTGMYFNNRIWKLSSPLDLLKFKALSFQNRIRLGLAILKARRVKDWKEIEGLSIREWLEPLCGTEAYKVVWEPLVNAKFSIFAEEVSAAWMWKKLVLRGGTRSKNGSESLLYIDGGFGELARVIAQEVTRLGGEILLNEEIVNLNLDKSRIQSAESSSGKVINPRKVIFTGAPSALAGLLERELDSNWIRDLMSVDYLGNICLVLLLDRSLSNTYWLNINDPGFPFVGVIEHTNLVSTSEYGDLHVVYLSRYLETSHSDYSKTNEEYFSHSIESLIQMFPEFEKNWIKSHYIWKAENAQPITVKNYSSKVPSVKTPIENLFMCTMAQIYPEDRGTNYAVRNAENLASQLLIDEE